MKKIRKGRGDFCWEKDKNQEGYFTFPYIQVGLTSLCDCCHQETRKLGLHFVILKEKPFCGQFSFYFS